MKFTGVKDLDKEILLRYLNDRDFIQTCQVNKYLNELCKENDYWIYKRRLEMYYPDILKKEVLIGNKLWITWKQYYGKVLNVIAEMKEKYNFEYIEGNPFNQKVLLKFFMTDTFGEYREGYNSLLDHVIENHLSNLYFPLIVYAIKKGAKITTKHMTNSLNDLKVLKYLIDNGGDPKFLEGENFSDLPKETQEYLHSLGL